MTKSIKNQINNYLYDYCDYDSHKSIAIKNQINNYLYDYCDYDSHKSIVMISQS